MAKVKLIANVYVDGKACKKGDTVDTKKAAFLIGAGKAEEVKTKSKD